MDGMYIPKIKPKYSVLKEILVVYISRYIYLRLADYIVYQGNYVKEIIVEYFGKSYKPSFIINNCISLDYKRPPYTLNGRVRLGYWASGIGKEQLELLLDIESSIHNLGLSSSISIVGPLNFEIDSSLISKLSDRVFLFGNSPLKSVYKFAEKIDIFLMIKGSPYPNTLVETLALGIPVVGLNKKGNNEIITQDVGILFEETSSRQDLIERYVNSILKIINNYPKYRYNIKNRYEKMFEVSIMKQKYLKIFLNDKI